MSTDKQHTATYLTAEQHERWKRRAEEKGMTLSEFIQAMTEAGMKKFEASVEPDETNRELRSQRNDLREELDHARTRIEELEGQLFRGERATIERFIRENPGVSYDDIVRHMIDTVPERVNDHIEELEGESITQGDGGYEPIQAGDEQ